MKKEKQVRSYQRRTKSGKMITVKSYTAKYDAAEALREAAKRRGAGEELENLKKVRPEKAMVEKPVEDSLDYGFTADEYKAWYHWDTESDPKNKAALKVEKALKKQMGTKAYNKYFKELTDSYSARGHSKAFKGLGDTLGAEKKLVTSTKVTKIPSSAVKVKTSEGDLYVSGTTLRTAEIYKETPSGIEKLHPKRGFSEKDAKKIEKALDKLDKGSSSSSASKKSPKERESTFKEKHAAKVEEWKKNGNVRQLKKEIAGIRLQYGSDRKKAEKLIKPLEEAIAQNAATSSKKSSKAPKTDSPYNFNKSALAKELKKYNGKIVGVHKKDGVIGVNVKFDHSLSAEDFAKKNKNWRSTTNVGTNYEFVLLNKHGVAALKKKGFIF